jgi:hypothetical protein
MPRKKKRHDFEKPDSDIARITELGMGIIEDLVRKQGGEVDQIFVAVTVKGMEPDALTAGHGFEDPAELVAWLLLHAQKAGERVGIPMTFMPGYHPN